jgi:superoxide dismutase, Fe-Mn family
MTSRREFLQKSVLAGIGITVLGKSALNAATSEADVIIAEGGRYTLPALPYPYDALEPWIDMRTMQIHHGKHHQAYVDNLNKALDEEAGKKPSENAPPPSKTATPDNATLWADLEARFEHISGAPVAIRNNGGGHWNHTFFWEIMRPTAKSPAPNEPSGVLLTDINATFGSFAQMKEQFNKAAKERFGSGWAWLIMQNGKLAITSTANQDNPLMDVADVKGRPILGLDVWEHAYYLKYQNVRTDYITNFWNVIDWDAVNKHYLKAK